MTRLNAKSITIRLDGDLRAVLDEMQREEGCTRTDMIHVLLRRGIEASRQREAEPWVVAELQRRIDRDTGIRYPLDDVLRASGITREELEEAGETPP